jgi:hypothetical protein
LARPERFELPTSWFVGSDSDTRKSVIRKSSHYASRLIFLPHTSPQALVHPGLSHPVLDATKRSSRIGGSALLPAIADLRIVERELRGVGTLKRMGLPQRRKSI